MRLLKFRANNLFSLGDIELDLDKRGLVLITGHSDDEGGANGSGKSSLSNKGVLWTLFGSTASGERADAAINRFADQDATCCGLLDVESNSGGKFRIVRSRNPNRLSVTDMATGADISCKTEKETQVLINKILGRTRETFLQTDFFGQGKLAAFLDLTPKAQVELLETILPFDRLAELSEKTKEYLSKLGVIQSSVERKIAEQTGKQMEAQRQERVLSDSIDKWDTEHASKLAHMEQQIKELEANTVAGRLEEWKQRVVELPNRSECTAKLHETLNYYGMLDRIEAEHTAELKVFQATMARMKIAPKVVDAGKCPTCRQHIDNATQAAIQHEHTVYERDWAGNQLRITETEDILALVRTRRAEAKETEREIMSALKQLDELEVEIARAESSQNAVELAILRQTLEDTRAEVNPYEAMYQQTSSNINMLTQNLSMHKARMDEVEKDKGALTFWRDAFGRELKSEFLSQVCPFIEARANQHLSGLGNPQLKVQVSTRKLLKSDEERSEFNLVASSVSGGGSYDSLSGGERQLVNFAVGLSLADLAELQTDGPSYFMVLDEPFMALDARNSEHLVNYLNTYLQGKKETILLVSNEETLKSLIPNRINVIKTHGVSRIE